VSQAGREAQEKAKREREKSEVDLELDFLAPFLAKFGDTELTRQQAMQVRDDCLESIKVSAAAASSRVPYTLLEQIIETWKIEDTGARNYFLVRNLCISSPNSRRIFILTPHLPLFFIFPFWL
jgi:hypothetical protein